MHKRDERNGLDIGDSPPAAVQKMPQYHHHHQNGIASSSVQHQQELHVPAMKRRQPAGGVGQDNVAFVADPLPHEKRSNSSSSSSTVAAFEGQSPLPASGNSIVREMSELHHLDYCKL